MTFSTSSIILTPILVLLLLTTSSFDFVGGLKHRQGHGVYGPRPTSRTDSAGGGGPNNGRGRPFFEVKPFDPQTGEGGRNLTTVEGGRAILTCVVRNLGGNNTVSWIRKGRHPVVLSSGRFAFTSDQRFSISHPKGAPDAWQLVIDPVMDRDNALYECQVNTRDKMSLVFKLNVQPAKAKLRGESSVYVKEGSTISLTCAINLFSVPPPDITWYRGRRVLNFDSPRGGISLETEKTRTGTVSKLLVTRANAADNGNYTCFPSRGESVSAAVHVIKDEQQFELRDGQTGVSSSSASSSSSAGVIRRIEFLLLYLILPAILVLSSPW